MKNYSSVNGVISLGIVLVACGASEEERGLDDRPDDPVLESAIEAHGGTNALAQVVTQTIRCTGQHFDFADSQRPDVPIQTGDFESTITSEVRSTKPSPSRLRLDQTNNLASPALTMTFSEIVDADFAGATTGSDSIPFGIPGAASATMPSARVSARQRESLVTSPIYLLQLASATAVHEEAEAVVDGRPNRVLSVEPPGEPALRLFFDSEKLLLHKAELSQDWPPGGDSLVEVVFDDYRPSGGVVVPFKLDMFADGQKIHTETRSAIDINVAVASDAFTLPPTTKLPYDAADGNRGMQQSSFLLNFQYLGLSGLMFNQLVFGPNTPITLNIESVAPGVYWARGLTHHHLIVEQSDHLIVVEAPLSPERMEQSLTQIKEMFPAKAIKFAVTTHFHFDHQAGVRVLAAEGATLVVGEPSKAFFEGVVGAKKTIRPDRLAMNPPAVDPVVQGVSDVTELTDSNGHRVQLIRMPTIHSDDMLIVYLPEEKMVFVSDLFNLYSSSRGMPALVPYKIWSGELYDFVHARGLDVSGGIIGGHGDYIGTLDDLRANGGCGMGTSCIQP